MHVSLRLLLASAAALLAANVVPGRAETFDFSYMFNTGDIISGSFSGTLSGDLVTNLTDINASLDGTPLNGPLLAFFYTDAGGQCATCWSSSGAVASFNPLLNNFLFADGAFTNYFYIAPWPNGVGNPVATQYYGPSGYIDYYNGQYIPANWSLTAVPELPIWAAMLMGFVGLGVLRRGAARRSASASAK